MIKFTIIKRRGREKETVREERREGGKGVGGREEGRKETRENTD